jgi:hypothetical protein
VLPLQYPPTRRAICSLALNLSTVQECLHNKALPIIVIWLASLCTSQMRFSVMDPR